MGELKSVTVGDTFERWTVVSNVYIMKHGHRHYLCQCACNNKTERYVDVYNLKSGKSVSCGCLKVEKIIERSTTHNGTHERLYGIWLGIKTRCLYPQSNHYYLYGGRGITICPEWLDYGTFREWAFSHGYREGLTKSECSIDRIDNNKGYNPDNCRWVDSVIQANNKRNNNVIEYDGIRKTIAEWSRETGLHRTTIKSRLDHGKSPKEALSKPWKPLEITYNGETHRVSEWAAILNIRYSLIIKRYRKGLPINEVLYPGNLTDLRRNKKWTGFR